MTASSRIGSVAALAAFVSIILYGIVQALQTAHVLRAPLDGIFIFGFSLCIVVPFVVGMLALHYRAPAGKRFWSNAALICAILYGNYAALNYTVQLATVIPATIHGKLDLIRVLDQTPHSLFWDIDALAYVFMGLATLCGSAVFRWRGIEGWSKGFFLANALMTPVVALVYFYPTFSVALLMLASPWIVTASASMLCLFFYLRNPENEVDHDAH